MSEEQLKAFVEKIECDSNLQERLKAAADSDEVAAIAKEAGFAIAAQDLQSMQSATNLSDDELESVIGGYGDCVSLTGVAGGTGKCCIDHPR